MLATAERIRDNLVGKPLISEFLADGSPEATLIWRDAEFGILKKARVDWMPHGHDVMLDLKTIPRAGFDDCMRAISRYGYRLQGAHYTEGSGAVFGERRIFILIFMEKEPPNHSRAISFTDEQLAEGRQKLRVASRRYAEAMASGVWPSYPPIIEEANLPRWAK
jgi:hypothetical protein